MPRPRFEKLAPEKKERILETAGQEFAQHGFDGASLNHILSAAGISKGAAYYYFDDKADLFATVLDHYWQHILGHVQVPAVPRNAEEFWEAATELYRQSTEHMLAAPWMMRLFRSVSSVTGVSRVDWLDPAVPPRLRGFLEGMMTWARQLLETGQRVGAVRTDLPMDLLFAVVVNVDEACDRWLADNGERLPPAELARLGPKLLGLLRRVMEPPTEDRP